MVYAPPRPAAPLPATPFHQALHEAHQRVVHAQAALPKQPTPHLPHVANPTPAQARAALTIARHSQRQALGPNPGVARIQRYQQELANDPRQARYLATVQHFARALAMREAPRQDLAEAGPVVPKPPAHEGAFGTLASILASAIGAQAGSPVLKGIEETGVKKGLSLGDAFAKAPIGTSRKTLTSIPQTLNALATGTARLGIEGTIEGKPGTALEQLVKGIASDVNRRYGGLGKPGGVEADAQRIEKEGALPELLDATLAVGGPASVAGKALSKAVEATGYGADEFAQAVRFREGLVQAAQAEHPASVVEPKLTRAQSIRAAIHESATQPRPGLRSAPGHDANGPSVLPGSAVKPQERSSNLFRALSQTALDNARRSRTARGLEANKAVRSVFQEAPRPALQPLAPFVKPGEVVPLIQKGGQSGTFPGVGFVGAAKQQRVGTSALKGSAVELRRAEATVLQKQFNEMLKGATPEQRLLLVHAKEGTLPLHDAAKAEQALREIHAQALEESTDAAGRSLIPKKDRRAGADVAQVTGKVLKHIDKHGAESVFTPEFRSLADALPDERSTAARDSSLSQDALVSRRYRPQVEHLERWAVRHPDAPGSRETLQMAEQIKQLETEGGDLRAGRAGSDLPAEHRHELAADKYATAHNLAVELAKQHELPTSPAYIEHTRRFTDNNLVHTVGNRGPKVQHQMTGQLAAKGYRSTDAGLILNGMLKNIRNDYKFKFLGPWHDRFNAAPEGLTAHEAELWRQAHTNPEHFAVAHIGKLRRSLAEDLHMEHAPHFNLDAEQHAVQHGNALDAVLGQHIPRSDVTKGAGVYPVAALNELKGVMGSSALPGRLLGKLKSVTSSLMLGTSLPWLETMSGVTYPVQSLYGGAGLVSLREAHAWYRGLPEATQRQLDHELGIDSPFEMSSHGITADRIGASAPKGFEELARVAHAMGDFPLVKLLKNNRPDHIILRMERVPRRYARINVAYKGIKHQALREMLAETKGAMAAHSKWQMGLARLEHFGRRPAAEYIDAALQNQHFMERHAIHLNNILGEWKGATQFERNILGRMVLFYPWLRYSVKLAAKTLPAEHPLAYALAAKYGTIQHAYLKELLGTDPTVGNVYLGPEQPNVAPEKRKFNVVGIRQANPLLNTVGDLLGAESPSQVLDVLPPYIAGMIEYFAGRNLFTGKGLKGADKGEAEYRPGHAPNFARFVANRAVGTFNPGRAAMRLLSHGAPQSDESLPFDLKPVQYSPKTQRKIAREHSEQAPDSIQTLLSELAPLAPHPDEGKITAKLQAEGRAAKELARKQRKEHHLAVRSGIASEADRALKAREQAVRAPAASGEAAAALAAREKLLTGR